MPFCEPLKFDKLSHDARDQGNSRYLTLFLQSPQQGTHLWNPKLYPTTPNMVIHPRELWLWSILYLSNRGERLGQSWERISSSISSTIRIRSLFLRRAEHQLWLRLTLYIRIKYPSWQSLLDRGGHTHAAPQRQDSFILAPELTGTVTTPRKITYRYLWDARKPV